MEHLFNLLRKHNILFVGLTSFAVVFPIHKALRMYILLKNRLFRFL